MIGAKGFLAALVFVAAAGIGLPAQAQTYRQNMPEVLAPDDAAESDEISFDEAEILERFIAAYGKQGRPRIAVFWNRGFSDRLSQWIASGRLLASQEIGAAIAIEEQGEQRTAEITGQETKTSYRQTNLPEARRPGMGALADAELESGFHRPLLDAGALLVDRAAIMRLSESNIGRKQGSNRVPDAQVIETEALKGYTDYLAEIIMLPDASAPHEKAFRVVVKSVLTGRIVANFVTRGEEPDVALGWRATAGGYVRETESPLSVKVIGSKLAFETMAALARAWR